MRTSRQGRFFQWRNTIFTNFPVQRGAGFPVVPPEWLRALPGSLPGALAMDGKFIRDTVGALLLADHGTGAQKGAWTHRTACGGLPTNATKSSFPPSRKHSGQRNPKLTDSLPLLYDR